MLSLDGRLPRVAPSEGARVCLVSIGAPQHRVVHNRADPPGIIQSTPWSGARLPRWEAVARGLRLIVKVQVSLEVLRLDVSGEPREATEYLADDHRTAARLRSASPRSGASRETLRTI